MKLGYLRVYASQRRLRRKTLHFNLLRNPRPTTTLTGRVVLPVLTGVKGGEKPDQRAEQNTATAVVGVRWSEGFGIWLGVAGAGNAGRA